MKIAVIGAGIIGVTTAYELACDGHEVTVLERRGAAAEEASFANAGIVAPGYVTPWAAPGMPAKVIQHLFSRYAPVKVGLPLSGRELAWIWKWYRACKLDTYLVNRAHLQRLAFYSRERLHHITADLKLEYERSDGYMVLLRSEQDNKVMQPGLQVLRDTGVAFKELNPVEARKIETALNPGTAFFGAVHLPDGEVGNCRQFALLLKNEAQRMGVKFSFNTTVTQMRSSGGVALGVAGENTPRQYDAAVLCAGLDSARLLGALGLKIPLAAVHGYSVSAAIREPLNAPRSAVMDEHYRVPFHGWATACGWRAAPNSADHPTKNAPAPCKRSTRFCTTGFPARPIYPVACRSGKARAPCCQTDRRFSAPAAWRDSG